MKKTISITANNWEYEIIMSSNNYGSWAREYALSVNWRHNNKNIQIDINSQSLWQELVSPDGLYMIMIFINFSDCNCHVYNQNGDRTKIICAPYLSNQQSIENHSGKTNIFGQIVGVENPYGKYSYLASENLMIMKIADPKRMYRGKWTEHRIFNPESGNIGELLFTNVSEDL